MAFRVKKGSIRVTPSNSLKRRFKATVAAKPKAKPKPKKEINQKRERLAAEERRPRDIRRVRQKHENNFTETDHEDIRVARLFFKHYEGMSQDVALPGHIGPALNTLFPAITRFKSLLKAEIPFIRNPDFTPDMVIDRVLNAPSPAMYIEAGQFSVALQMAERFIPGFQKKYAYALVKDIWKPEKKQ